MKLSHLCIAEVTGIKVLKLSYIRAVWLMEMLHLIRRLATKMALFQYTESVWTASHWSVYIPSSGIWGWSTTIGFYNFDLILILYV